MTSTQAASEVAQVGKSVENMTTDQKEQESDDELVRSFLQTAKNGVIEPPTEEQLKEIKAFEDKKPFLFTRAGSNKSGTKGKRKAKKHRPNMRQVCEGMCMEFFCNMKPSSDNFIQWIYLKNKSSEDATDDQVVACKKLDCDGAASATFKVGDNWKYVTPYSYSSLGAWFKGDEVVLDDDDGSYADLANWSDEQIDEYFKEKEPDMFSENQTFKATQAGGKLRVECSIPVMQMWVRSNGKIVLAKQFEDPEDGEEPEDAIVEEAIASPVKTIHVYAYGVLESGDIGTLAAKMTL